MEDLFQKLKNVDKREEFQQTIDQFLKNYSNATRFECIDENNFRDLIWKNIFTYLENEKESSNIIRCLTMLRVLSRDKTNLNNLVTRLRIDLILKHAKLDSSEHESQDFSVVNEAQKVLYNLLFNSSYTSSIVMETPCVETILHRINKYDRSKPHEINFFDVRIIFLITVRHSPSRSIIRTKFNGDTKLLSLIENITSNYKKSDNIPNTDAELICEVMKVLFNLFLDLNDPTPDKLKEYKNMMFLVRRILSYENEKYKEVLVCNIVNLLIVTPSDCYEELISPLAIDNERSIDQQVDMTGIDTLIEFLSRKLECKSNLIESLSPILTSLIRMCKKVRTIRKYVRLQVLPPLKEVKRRPEEGTTIRNKLCKLLTTPITVVKDLDAEFLFILCKENVGRMIKYTGYGNAAGMFANKGLLGAEHARVNHSSDSEESDTEEYEKYKERINPVTGCYEEVGPNPLEGMSEEQKEYEAMKLISLVDKLQRQGIIQPCTVGEDGRPRVIEHVLELQDKLPEEQIGTKRNSDSY